MTLHLRPNRRTGAVLASLVTGAVAGAALTVGAPATAAPLTLPTTGTTSTQAAHASWGTATSKDHRLQPGCHSYAFRYRVTTPASDWMAEIKLISPAGRSVATHTFVAGVDPRRSVSHFRVCSSTTKPGRHEIRMRVTSYTGPQGDDAEVRTSKPTHFRFTA